MAQETDRILYQHIPKKKKRLMLFDIREGLHIDGDARRYSAEQGGENIKALAILLKGAFARNMYEIFLRFQNPSYPMKSFTNKEAAIEWLKKEHQQKTVSLFNFSWRKGLFYCCSILAMALALFLIF